MLLEDVAITLALTVSEAVDFEGLEEMNVDFLQLGKFSLSVKVCFDKCARVLIV